MTVERWLTEEDIPLLTQSLEKDEYHKDTKPEFFTQIGTVCKVYEDDAGPVMFVRGTKALRIDIQFVDNNDRERNRAIMEQEFQNFAASAKAAGFTELVFCTDSPILKAFCKRRFQFREVGGELRRFL